MGLVAPRHVGSSWTRDQIRVLCIGRQILNHCTTREVPVSLSKSALAVSTPSIRPGGLLPGHACAWSPRKWGALGHCPLNMLSAFLRTRTGQGEHPRWPGKGAPQVAGGWMLPFPEASEPPGGGVWPQSPSPALTSFTQLWQKPMALCQLHGGGLGGHPWDGGMTSSRSLL